MLVGMFLFAAADMLAKVLTASFHPVQIIWFRQLGLAFGVLILLTLYGKSVLSTRQPRLQLLRGALVVCSSILFVYAIRYTPLVDAVAASFVAPFFLTILGVFLLKEKVGIRRWSAVFIGFIGALIVIRPGLGVIHPAVMLVVVAAGFYAARQVIGRILADTDTTVTTITYTALTATFIISFPLPFFWQLPESATQWWLLLSLATLAGFGEIFVIKALEVAEAAVVAPVHYTLILWGTAYGYLVFNQLPDRYTWIGAAIIIAAGLYTLQRDKRSHQ